MNKTTGIGSMLSADMTVDPGLERQPLSLSDMKVLPYLVVYDSRTERPAVMADIN